MDIRHLKIDMVASGSYIDFIDGMTVAYEMYPGPVNSALVVTLCNLIGRSLQVLPVFDPLVWSHRADFSRLSICDPTLYMDDKIEVTNFLGTIDRDPIPVISRVISEARKILNPSKVIVWGASGAGFAAVKLASALSCNAVAINSQISILPLKHWPVVKTQSRLFGYISPVELAINHPTRADITSILHKRAFNKILWAQNEADTHHFYNHYCHVCKIFDIEKEGGQSSDGKFIAYLYSSPEAHAPAPTHVLRSILDQALLI